MFQFWKWKRVQESGREVAARDPIVLTLRHAVRESWTKEEAQWLAGVMGSPAWEKLERFSEDSIRCDVLDREMLKQPEFLRGFVAGRLVQLEYQRGRRAGAKEPDVPDPEREQMGVDGADGERTAIEMSEER